MWYWLHLKYLNLKVNQLEDRTIIVVTGLLSIVIIEAIALLMGHNGAYLSLALTSIGGIIGYSVKGAKDKIKPEG